MKLIKKIVTATILLCSLSANAADFYAGRIGYNIKANRTLEAVEIHTDFYHTYKTENLVIPETVEHKLITYTVKSIGIDFGLTLKYGKNTNIKSITIPGSVTEIKAEAFKDCFSLETVNLPEGLISIGEYAFMNCDEMTSIKIPSTVKTIGKRSFEGCRKLSSSITIPSGVTSIGLKAFAFCSSIPSVNIEEGVSAIETATFAECTNLKSITIPSSVKSIGKEAFYKCSRLNSVFISSIKDWCEISFDYGSIGDSNPLYYADLYLNGEKVEELIVPKDVTTIGRNAFGRSKFKSLIVGENVLSIDKDAFSLPGKTIYLCKNRPEGYENARGVVNYVPSDDYKERIFQTTYVLPHLSAMFQIGRIMYVPINFTEHTCCVLSSSYSNEVQEVNITESLLHKGETLKIVDVMPRAFYDNDNIIKVSLQNTGSIGESAFYDCSALKEVAIGNKVTSINAEAFSKCAALESVSFGCSVNTIGANAFAGCNNISEIVSSALTPPQCEESSFNDINKENCVLKVPQNYKEAYQTANQWKTFALIEDVVEVERYLLKFIVDGELYEVDSLAYSETIVLPNDPIKEGYTFSGWSETPETMPAGDITITGTFAINKYLVTFKIGDEVITSDSLEYKSVIVAPEAPTKEGHTFNGWGEVADSVPAHNLTYNGGYSVNSYLLTYVVDGDTIKSDSITYGTTITLLEEPQKEGYTFSGWSEVPEVMPASNLTISGTFTINKYLVIFKIDDEVIAADSLEYGAAIVVPEVPEREGHTFNGWGTVEETVPTHNVTYEGSYSVNSYLLTYTVDGDTIKSDSIAYGTTITSLEEPKKEGHTFSGWSETPETMPAKDVTVIGTFVVNAYKVTYILDGEVFKVEEVVYGTAIPTPEVPAKEGYNFSGWGEIPENMPAHDLTLTGSYTINKDMKYDLIYMVDGVEYKRVTLSFGDAIVLEEEPTKEGHTFSGWSEVPETMPLHDVTVTGSFTANSYTLTYVLDGETFKTEEVVYGTTIITPEAPTKEGYTFGGWENVPETMPANDVTISGTFTVNKYLVTFKIGDEVIASDSLEYGTAIIAPEAPDREGHTFNGWGEVAETVPANDVIYEGSYTVNTYKVYYYVGEELVHTEEVTYGEIIPEYTYEPEEGYTFLGWIGESYETMPAHDVTYTANIESGIDSPIASGQQQTVIYDLTGRKVTDIQNLKGGIYIINGKKVVIK